MSSPTLTAILFDLDGTLFDRDTAVARLVAAQHRHFSTVLAHVPREQFISLVLELDAHGYGDKTMVYHQVAETYGLDEHLAEELTAHFWSTYHRSCQPFPEGLNALSELRAMGLSLGLITNGSVQIQQPVIDRLGLDQLLDVALISEREGVRKPDAEIFARAASRLDTTVEQCWYVGDHPAVDVEGAQAAGLTAIWRHMPYWPMPNVPCRTIHSLDELVPMARMAVAAETPP